MNIDMNLFHRLFRAHPWHGISIGDDAPDVVNAYIEIVPSDTVKYELDKPTGHLKVDRPQKFSNVYPTLYGLIPQTYCGDSIAEFCMKQASRTGIVGDGDPLDVIVLGRAVPRGAVVRARVIGVLKLLDGGERDDKILAVLDGDPLAEAGSVRELDEEFPGVTKIVEIWFESYKGPGELEAQGFEGPDAAMRVIRSAAAAFTQ